MKLPKAVVRRTPDNMVIIHSTASIGGVLKTLGCAIACLLVASTASAARSFQVEDLQKLSRVGGARISPDGKWVAFTVTGSDVAKKPDRDQRLDDSCRRR